MKEAASTPKNIKKSTSASKAINGGSAKSTNSISSVISRVSNSEKRRQKAELKKMKKSMKNAGQDSRASYMPDSAINSPLVGKNLSNGGSVELKSLRPRGSMANIRYPLPLKATPGK